MRVRGAILNQIPQWSVNATLSTDHTVPTGVNLPYFLKKYNYVEPVDLAKLDNYRDMTGGKDFFATCAADPVGKGSSFMGLMTALRNHKMSWTDVYDTNRIVDDADVQTGKPLFVDIGGAHGLDTSRLLDKHPDLPANVLVLQDTPEVGSVWHGCTIYRCCRSMYL